jgi:hypothetical protein
MKRFAAIVMLLWAAGWAGLGVYGAARAPGAASVQGSVDAGQPVSGWPLLMGGEDGNGNAQYLLTDNTGKLIVSPNTSSQSVTLGSRITTGDTQINATTTPTRALGVAQADGVFSFPDGQALLQTIPIGLTSLNTLYMPVRPEIYNGTTMDKIREPTAANNSSSGVGIVATAQLAYDSSAYQRLGTTVAYADASSLTGTNTAVLPSAPWIFNGTNWDRERTNAAAPTTAYRLAVATGAGAMTSLNAVTATGNGTAFNLGTCHKDFGFQITTTGAPTAIAVQIQGSLDGANWSNIGNSQSAAGLYAVSPSAPCTWVRAQLNTLTGGTTPTVTVLVCAM